MQVRRAIHILPNPLIPSNPRNTFDAFTIYPIRFSKLMLPLYDTIFYGTAEYKDHIPCSKFVPVISSAEYLHLKTQTNQFQNPSYMVGDQNVQQYEQEIGEIFVSYMQKAMYYFQENYKPGDILAYIYWLPTNITIPGFENIPKLKICAMGGKLNFELQNHHIVFITKSHLIERVEDQTKTELQREEHKEDKEKQEQEYKEKQEQEYKDKQEQEYKGKQVDEYLVKKCNSYDVILPWFEPDEFQVLSKQKTILFLARVQKYKGIHLFLLIASQFPEYQFVVAGGSHKYCKKDRYFVVEDKTKLYLPSNVHYKGCVGATIRKKLLGQASCLIQLSTYNEPCGLNVIEALLSNTPVIASAEGGFQETVRVNFDGFLVDVKDANCVSLACEALKKIMDRKWETRRSALERFGMTRARKQYEKLIEGIFERSKI